MRPSLLRRSAILRQRSLCTALRLRTFSSSSAQFLAQDVFHAQLEDSNAAAILSSLQNLTVVPQTLTEKIVQKYAVGLPKGKFVKSGDYARTIIHGQSLLSSCPLAPPNYIILNKSS
jgi:homoaconitate hydratase